MLNQIYNLHELMEVIIQILDSRDPYTYQHSWRVAALCECMVSQLNLSQDWEETIHVAAHLHDIGKIGVPDYILNKPDKLTLGEYELMKAHSEIGFEIVRKIPSLEKTALYVRHHHERWDGCGYPAGLAGKKIPFGARIIAVADTFDAMTSSRPYQKGIPYKRAFEIIAEESGRQLCPEACEAFLNLQFEIVPLMEQINRKLKKNVGLLPCP
jgi:putative nucleotidyltransferase with HDIG domain